MNISCLILAAGRSARMGGSNKLLLPVEGEALVRRTALEVCKVHFEQIIVVTGFESEKIQERLSDLPLTFIHNPQHLSGMHSSLRAGLMALTQPLDGFFVCLSDQPHFDHRVLEKMRQAFVDHGGEKIIYPSFDGQRGQPTLIPARFIPEILDHEDGDHGAMYLFKKYPQMTAAVTLEKPDPLIDLDTPADYSGFIAHGGSDFMADTHHSSSTTGLEKFASKVTAWAERWFPDSYIFAVLAIVVVTVGALLAGISPSAITTSFGEGYWSLIPFTMQMAIVVISGYVVASSPPAGKLIKWLATIPKTERSAIAYIALFTILASLLNWAFSLVFGGLYVRALARRADLRIDYRAAGAAGYLGLGATWALGLSSSAAQLQANADSIPKSLLPITGVIPFSETIFLPQSLIMLAVLLVVSVVIAYLSAPTKERSVTAADLGVDVHGDVEEHIEKPKQPGEWLEYSPLLTIFVVCIGFAWLGQEFYTKNVVLTISNLNTYNFLFLMLGMLLTWRPKRFLKSISKAVPSVAGILIQFPIHGSIAFILTKATGADGATLSHHISDFFVSISTRDTFSALMGVYSAVLGFFIPSGGGKWIIEAPYLMQAANELKVHLGWTVMVYNAAEALPNLINPFFMMALLGVLGLKARDIVGYTVTQLVVHAPLVIFMLWALGETLTYHPPIIP